MADKLQEILETLEQGIEDFWTGEKFKTYLDVMSRFHEYSVNNQILIALQNPDATLVAGYSSWINKFERHVRHGEKAIRILAPQKHRIEVEADEKDEYGNPVKKQIERISFRPVNVFDVSQTEGKELPELVSELEGNVNDYEMFMEAISMASPYHINIMNVSGSKKGWCDPVSENVVIKSGMSELQTIKTAIHETAHARLHGVKNDKDRQTKEIEAEGCAYAVCKHFGLDTDDYSFGYVAAWSAGKSKEELMEAMKTIHDEAKDIIKIVDEHFSERKRSVEGVKVTELEERAQKAVNEVLDDLIPFSGAGAVKARFYGNYKIPEEPAVAKVLVEYKGSEREDDVFNALAEKKISVKGVKLDINPIKPEKSGTADYYYSEVKKFERQEMTDDTWPMITVTYSSTDHVVTGKRMNIYEAAQVIDGADAKLNADNIKGNFLRINVAYTYAGRKEEKTDVVILGEGRRKFMDYLNLSEPELTYMRRHYQLLDTLDVARHNVSKGSYVSEMYDDMMLEWAEDARRELNYNLQPEIKKPPEIKKSVSMFKEWEMER